MLSATVGFDHKQPSDPHASRFEADRDADHVKQPIERLKEHETNRFAEKLSDDRFAIGEPIGCNSWTIGGSGQKSAQGAVTNARLFLDHSDGLDLILS